MLHFIPKQNGKYNMQLYSTSSIREELSCIYLIDENVDWRQSSLSSKQIAYIQSSMEQKIHSIHFNELGHHVFCGGLGVKG